MKKYSNTLNLNIVNSQKKWFPIFFVVLLITSLLFPLTLSAENAYTPVSGGTVNFEKYLIYKEQANCPNVNFEFEIQPGQSIPVANGKQAIIAGNNSAVSGTPVMYCANNHLLANKAHFDKTKQKFNQVQNLNANLGQSSGLSKDPITLQTGEVYSRDEVTVDFTGVTFAEPGVYRWIIVEKPAATTAVAGTQSGVNSTFGITNDSNTTRYLDVYVNSIDFQATSSNSGRGTLEIAGYVLHNSANFQPSTNTPVLEPSDSSKAVGFTNSFTSYDVTLTNTVGGNQGSIDKYFRFTVSITNAGANNLINFTGAHDSIVTVSTRNSVTNSSYKNAENPTDVITDSDGSAIVDVYLQHGQTFVVQGLPENTKVRISEIQDDYSPNYQVISNGQIRDQASTNAAEITAISSDSIIAFTNTKSGTIPTGIINNVLPGIAIVIAGIAVSVFVIRKRLETTQTNQ